MTEKNLFTEKASPKKQEIAGRDYCRIHGKNFDERCADCVHIMRQIGSRMK